MAAAALGRARRLSVYLAHLRAHAREEKTSREASPYNAITVSSTSSMSTAHLHHQAGEVMKSPCWNQLWRVMGLIWHTVPSN